MTKSGVYRIEALGAGGGGSRAEGAQKCRAISFLTRAHGECFGGQKGAWGNCSSGGGGFVSQNNQPILQLRVVVEKHMHLVEMERFRSVHCVNGCCGGCDGQGGY